MRRFLWLKYLPDEARKGLEHFRTQLARPDAILALSLLGLVAGLLAAGTIIALRLLVAELQVGLFPMEVAEDFESLSPWWRLGAATGGGLLIGWLYYLTSERSHTVGILHVLERLERHQGRLTWRNTIVQFIGGAISMISGHSVGREGPSAHLGAASSNLPAQALNFPNNSLRILAACGAAAGIAASFNTPLAGAVFATEVLLMEYTVTGFAPIIMATVSATAMTRAVFGSDLAYDVPRMDLGGLHELPYILICGVLIGLLAGGFNRLFKWVSVHSKTLPSWLRPGIAGLLVGLCGMVLPEVMGVGDDTVNTMLLGKVEISLLVAFLVVKILVTAGGIGLGLPGGLIGPILFVGAASGGLLHAVGALLGITDTLSAGFYALIGMGAMMAGMMIAPMAGLIAILEMSGEPHIILPGMLAIVGATITSGYFSNRESVFHILLRARGFVYRADPVAQSLRRIGALSVMNRGIVPLPRKADAARIDEALAAQPLWIQVQEADRPSELLKAVDLVAARKEWPDNETYDLLEIPGERLHTSVVDMRASLHEVQEKMDETGHQAVLVMNHTVLGIPRVQGVLTRKDVEDSYRY